MEGLSLSEDEFRKAAGPYGHHRKLNKDQSLEAIKDMAFGYLNSFPGRDSLAGNRTIHQDARALIKGERIDAWRREPLQQALFYRLGAMKLASEHKNLVGLDFANCDVFDMESWEEHVLGQNRDPRTKNPKYERYQKYMEIVDDAGVFDLPAEKAGYVYDKPRDYLAVAFLESGLSVNAVESAVVTILTAKAARVQALTERIRKDVTVRSIGAQAFTSLGKRLRSASPPRKRAPLPSFSEVMG